MSSDVCVYWYRYGPEISIICVRCYNYMCTIMRVCSDYMFTVMRVCSDYMFSIMRICSDYMF